MLYIWYTIWCRYDILYGMINYMLYICYIYDILYGIYICYNICYIYDKLYGIYMIYYWYIYDILLVYIWYTI